MIQRRIYLIIMSLMIGAFWVLPLRNNAYADDRIQPQTPSETKSLIPIANIPVGSSIVMSASGRYVVYQGETTAGYALYRYDMVTQETLLLRQADGALSGDNEMYISPNEQEVLYLSNGVYPDLFHVSIDGGANVMVLDESDFIDAVEFTADSRYAVVGLPNVSEKILRIDLANDTVVELDVPISDLASFTVSPDGKYVIFRGRYATEAGVVSIEGGRATMVPFIENIILHPQTTSYNTLLFAYGGKIYEQPIGSDQTREIASFIGNRDIQLMTLVRDNTLLVVIYTEGVWLVNLRTGTKQLLATHESNDPYTRNYVLNPTFSRGSFFFTLALIDCVLGDCDTYLSSVHRLSLDGRDDTLAQDGYTFQLSPDAHYLFYSPLDQDKIFSQSLIDLALPPLDLGISGSDIYAGNRSVYVRSRYFTEEGDFEEKVSAARLPEGATEILSISSDHAIAGATEDDVFVFRNANGELYATGNPSPPVTFALLTPLHAEGETITVTVSLESMPLQPVTVDYALTGGTAIEGEDFTFTPGTLTFAPFERTKTFTVELIDDGVEESVETAIFTLSNIEGGSAGEQTTYMLKIADEVYEQQLPLLQR